MEVNEKILERDPSFRDVQAQLRMAAEEYGLLEAALPATSLFKIVVPVVVQVVFNTIAQNISDEQIASQIDCLNSDFNKRNSDLTADTAGSFLDLAASARIEFKLATLDPAGNPSTGITRTKTDVLEFGDDNGVKCTNSGGIDPWPTDKFLNIWVCELQPDLLGYAQFPGGPPETDGVVVNHGGFGTLGTATAPFNLGRTTTHEVGHWFNLLHIWGKQDGCSDDDDEVDDTPRQERANYGKPGFPHISCGNGPTGDMFCNFMDYVDDDTMVMFTQGQVERMHSAIEKARSAFLIVAE